MMERLNRLFEQRYGCTADEVVPLTGSASPRLYYRMNSEAASCVGVIGTDRQENEAFVYLADHFRSKGLPVPQVYAVSEDAMAYIQEDLGGECLFDSYSKAKKSCDGLERVEALLLKTVGLLPKMQIEGAQGLDFTKCHPQQEFSVRSAMFDLDYFKYYFPRGLRK